MPETTQAEPYILPSPITFYRRSRPNQSHHKSHPPLRLAAKSHNTYSVPEILHHRGVKEPFPASHQSNLPQADYPLLTRTKSDPRIDHVLGNSGISHQ